MLTIENNWIYLTCTEQQAQKLDAVWVKSKNMWRLPNNLGSLRELHRMGFDVLALGKQKAEAKQRLVDLKTTEAPLFDNRLRPYQNQDINFLKELPHCGIFSEMRTGKSPMTIKLLEAEGHEKAIIICPASLVLNWRNEIKAWSSYEVFAVNGSKTKRSKTYQEWQSKKGCLVLSKDTAKLDYDLLKAEKGYCLVIDEAHFLRNYQTKQSKAIFQLGKNASKRIALTGTPATGKGEDIFGILHFLYPSRFSSYWQFVDRYFKVWETPWGSKEVSGYKRKEELQEILDLISVQRKRSDVMKWIPAIERQTITLEMPPKQRKAYEEMLHLFTVEESGVDAPSVLAQLTRLRQICLAPELLEIKAPSAKEQFILEWLEDNQHEYVIIFSNFSSYLRILAGRIKGSKLIIGETPKQERQKTVESFQAGKTKVILANIQAAGTGLTLDEGSTIIFLDRDYVPANNEQAEARILPTTENSNQNCMIIDIVCEDSIDQKVNDMLAKKQNIIEVINNYKGIKDLMNT